MVDAIHTHKYNKAISPASQGKSSISDTPPRDAVMVSPYCLSGEKNNIMTFSSEKVEDIKKDMEKEGYIFDENDHAAAIIYSNGKEHQLFKAENVVTTYGGKITGTLWLIDAFTAELSPEAYCVLREQMPGYRPVPDNCYEKLIKPPPATNIKQNPAKALLALSDLLGLN